LTFAQEKDNDYYSDSTVDWYEYIKFCNVMFVNDLSIEIYYNYQRDYCNCLFASVRLVWFRCFGAIIHYESFCISITVIIIVLITVVITVIITVIIIVFITVVTTVIYYCSYYCNYYCD